MSTNTTPSLAFMLANLNDANHALLKAIQEKESDLQANGSMLAGDDAKLQNAVTRRLSELARATTMVTEGSTPAFSKGAKALLSHDDKRTAREQFRIALRWHDAALDILEGRTPTTQPTAGSPKEPTQAPADALKLPTPKVDKPKDDKKVAGDEPVLTSAPWPTRTQSAGEKPSKPADDTPAWAQALGATLTGHIEDCKQEIRESTLPPEIREVLTKRDAAALEAALTAAEKSGARMDEFQVALDAASNGGLRDTLAAIVNGFSDENVAKMMAWLFHKMQQAERRDQMFGRFRNFRDVDEQDKPTPSSPTASPTPKATSK